MERNTIELAGEFKEVAFSGGRTIVFIFQDYRFGEYAIGVHENLNIEIPFNTPQKALVRITGKKKVKSDGFVDYFIHGNLQSIEPIMNREGV